MASVAFTRNYTDRSNDTGYQFEFHCDKCRNGHRSTFRASALGVGSKIAKGLGSLFGRNQLWSVGHATEYMKDGLRARRGTTRSGRDRQITRSSTVHPRGKWVFPRLWNEQRHSVQLRANLAEEAAHHQAQVASHQLHDKIRNVDQVGHIDPVAEMAGACAHCQSRLQPGAKFCPGCGKPTGAGAAKSFCTGCGAQLPPGARFCSGCGAQQG